MLALVVIMAAPPLPDLATDVSGYSRGVEAAPFDPAAATWAQGFELHLRHRFAESDGKAGAYLLAPLGGLALYSGYDWLGLPDGDSGRLSVGAALRLSERAAFGVALRDLHTPAGDATWWDLGLSYVPSSWLSLSLGVDATNAPRLAGARQDPVLRAGIGLRPLAGAPWLTLAGDARFIGDRFARVDSRVLVDVGWRGVHLIAAYGPDDHTLWLGAGVALSSLDIKSTVAPGGVASAAQHADEAGTSLTLRASPSESIAAPSDRRVVLSLSGDLRDEPTGVFDRRPTISTLPLTLASLAQDPSVGTLVLEIGGVEVGLATVGELRRAIAAARNHGKRVIAEITNADDKAYLIAAAAQHIRMDPAATLHLDGFAITSHYLAGALDKLGIHFDTVEIGRYKSGADALTKSEPRPEDVEIMRAILSQAYEGLVQAVASGRGKSVDEVRALITRGVFTAAQAKEAGLVDELWSPLATRHPFGERPSAPPPSARWGSPAEIAVVPITGTLVVSDNDNPLPGDSAEAPAVVSELQRVCGNEQVVAVVVRVDSGGGDVYASELMWRAIKRCAEAKPVVVSMGEVAASGGYYLATAAPVILAENDTLTGSIGIFSLHPNLSELYRKTGVSPHIHKQGPRADWSSLAHALRPEDRAAQLAVLQSYYDLFISRVAEGRGLPPEQVRKELAEGRVFTGKQAHAVHLVDELGGLADAVAVARRRAGIQEDEQVTVTLPRRGLALGRLLELVASDSSAAAVALEELRRRTLAWGHWGNKVLALSPVVFEVGP